MVNKTYVYQFTRYVLTVWQVHPVGELKMKCTCVPAINNLWTTPYSPVQKMNVQYSDSQRYRHQPRQARKTQPPNTGPKSRQFLCMHCHKTENQFQVDFYKTQETLLVIPYSHKYENCLSVHLCTPLHCQHQFFAIWHHAVTSYDPQTHRHDQFQTLDCWRVRQNEAERITILQETVAPYQ